MTATPRACDFTDPETWLECEWPTPATPREWIWQEVTRSRRYQDVPVRIRDGAIELFAKMIDDYRNAAGHGPTALPTHQRTTP